jgi:hypothetical protein
VYCGILRTSDFPNGSLWQFVNHKERAGEGMLCLTAPSPSNSLF